MMIKNDDFNFDFDTYGVFVLLRYNTFIVKKGMSYKSIVVFLFDTILILVGVYFTYN